MGGLIRILFAAGVIGGLGVLLRELFADRPQLLRTSESSAPQGHRPKRKATSDEAGPSRAELYEQAQRLEIEGRSKMSKRQLERAVAKARGGGR